MTSVDIGGELEQFLRDNYHIRPGDPEFTRSVDLWDAGYVDSTAVIEIIAFLEDRLGLVLPESVLFSPQFRSIDGILRLTGSL
jgi:acyl carrier protein